MIKLAEYVHLLLMEKMTPNDAVNIFAKYGVDVKKLDQTELRNAWIELNKKYYPKENDADPEISKEINAAYDILKNRISSSHGNNTDHTAGRSSVEDQRLWHTDPRAMKIMTDLKAGTPAFVMHAAWKLSGKPSATDANKYLFSNWNGNDFSSIITVFTTPQHFFKVSQLTPSLDDGHVKSVFVSHSKEPHVIYLVNHNGNEVKPPKKYEHESFNMFAGNDKQFVRQLRSEL